MAVLWQGNSAALQITCWGMTIRMACACAKLPECGLSVHQSSAMSQNSQVPELAFPPWAFRLQWYDYGNLNTHILLLTKTKQTLFYLTLLVFVHLLKRKKCCPLNKVYFQLFRMSCVVCKRAMWPCVQSVLVDRLTHAAVPPHLYCDTTALELLPVTPSFMKECWIGL